MKIPSLPPPALGVTNSEGGSVELSKITISAFLCVGTKRTFGTASEAKLCNVSDYAEDVLSEDQIEAPLVPRNLENLKARPTCAENLLVFSGAEEITCNSLHRCRWRLHAQGVHRHCRKGRHGGRWVGR